MVTIQTNQVMDIYRKRAPKYNFTANLYYLIGFREYAYRKRAVKALHLRQGDTVVEIGCGTGLNFALLQKAVGAEGKIIGVDLTDAMLSEAQKRVEQHSWLNVELIHCDAASFDFPPMIEGVLSTFALSLMPSIDKIIKNGAAALSPGKRWVVLDLKEPSNWLRKLRPLFLPIVRPFDVTDQLIRERPWETVRQSFQQHLKNTSVRELYGGFSFLITGEA